MADGIGNLQTLGVLAARTGQPLSNPDGPSRGSTYALRVRYTFAGVVYPERAPLTMQISPLTVDSPHFDTPFTVRLSVIDNQISVVVDLSEDVDLYTLRNVVESIVARAIDAVGYSLGRRYSVELVQAWRPDDVHVFGIETPVLTDARAERPLSLEDAAILAVTDHHLGRSLADLRQAARFADDTAFYSYRAIESLRHHWPGDEKSQWKAMGKALNLDIAVGQRLKRWADRQRHGASEQIMSDDDRAASLTTAWRVVDRYCVLLHRHLEQIPTDEFALSVNGEIPARKGA
jgi:hypothetical protein